jgi:hypothetical protein
MKKIFIFAAAAIFLFSCKKNDEKSGTFNGPGTGIQKGKGWSWIKLDGEGIPQQLGLSIDDAAMNSLPVGTTHTGEDAEQESSVILPLHPLAKSLTPFDHIEVDWNPTGHPPVGIYDKPHFDFHFYMVPEGEVKAATDPAKLAAYPTADYLPLKYIAPAPPVPQMGQHFLDATSPELNGQPFTQTFIYGTYDSKVTFYEPMITLNFLKSATTFERPIPQPSKFRKAGLYPTEMRVIKHDGVTDVILDGFVQRQAS